MQAILDSDSIDLTEREKLTAFFYCCENGDRVGVQKLLDIGAPATAYDGQIHPDVWTGLQAAILSGNVELVAFLLENGANVLVNTPGWIIEPPLEAVVRKGSPEVVRLLLDHSADVHAETMCHGTALGVA